MAQIRQQGRRSTPKLGSTRFFSGALFALSSWKLNVFAFSEMKGGLKKFIDLTAELQDGNSTKEGSPYGFLIQVGRGGKVMNDF